MAKTKKQKQNIIDDYTNRLNKANAVFIISSTKIDPNETNTLRKILRKNNTSIKFLKNTLFKIALDKTKTDLDNINLEEENAAVFCQDDPCQTAKILASFTEKSDKGSFKCGNLNKKFITRENIIEISKLPSKDVLISITVRTIAAPITNFVQALNGNLLNFVNVLKNISEQKEK